MGGSSNAPINLWALARQFAPVRCRQYVLWVGMTVGGLGILTHRRVKLVVQREWRFLRHYDEDLGLQDYDPGLIKKEDELLTERAEEYRTAAFSVLLPRIKNQVRRALMSGAYHVTGTSNSGNRVELSINDMACLDIDITMGTMFNHISRFERITIKPKSDVVGTITRNEAEINLEPTKNSAIVSVIEQGSIRAKSVQLS